MSDLVETIRQEILVERAAPSQDILEVFVERTDIVDVAVQGPPGTQGIQGPPGGVSLQLPAGATLSGHRVVMLGADNRLVYASCDNEAHMGRPIGITTQSALAGELCTVQRSDSITESSWSWAPDEPVFLGVDGSLVQSAPAAGFVMIVGIAISPKTLFVSLREPILLTD